MLSTSFPLDIYAQICVYTHTYIPSLSFLMNTGYLWGNHVNCAYPTGKTVQDSDTHQSVSLNIHILSFIFLITGNPGPDGPPGKKA